MNTNMTIYILIIVTLSVFITLGFTYKAFANKPTKWAVYYSDKATINDFTDFDLIVFDSDKHPSLQPFNDRGKTTLAYISIAEVNKERSYFKEVEKQNILLGSNTQWKDSFYVDTRSEFWISYVIDKIIPSIIHEGFDGIFIDTIDSAIYLENKAPKKHANLSNATANLIKAIRYNFPYLKIMVNRGLEIADTIVNDIDIFLAESAYTDYDFLNKQFLLQPDKNYKAYIGELKKLKKKNPKLELFSLDYWNLENKEEINEIYKIQKSNGFSPYVSNIELDKIYKHEQ